MYFSLFSKKLRVFNKPDVFGQNTVFSGPDMQIGLDLEEMEQIVQIINQFREDVARGVIKGTDESTLPTPTDLSEIRRSADLECMVLRWVYDNRKTPFNLLDKFCWRAQRTSTTCKP